ncbi:DciA family protein [Propionivibrio sp.]|uniref:DciA family protein n=1 Tax=Propionivibrio sp. TaxID=2212460 RepID=UPI002609F9FA|nr:DciA family protein [Propionivibrio sp.]
MKNSLEHYLEATDGAGKVLAHARLLIKLTRLYQEIAPAHLNQASSLANYKSGIIVIHAVSGAVAAKLRQLAPTLADGFSQRGVECNGVQIKVQARKTVTQSMASTQKPLTSRASRTLESLRDSLPASPLRAALETLLMRAAKTE